MKIKNYYKAHSNLKDTIEINRIFADDAKNGLKLFEEHGTDLKIESDVLGEYKPNISNCKYYHDIWLSYNLKEPIKKGHKFVIVEEFNRNFLSNHLKFPAIYPSKRKEISLCFEGLKPTNAYFQIRSGGGIIKENSINIIEKDDCVYYFNYFWKKPKVGESLFIRWSWPSDVFLQEEK